MSQRDPTRARVPSSLQDIYGCKDPDCGLSQIGHPVHSRGNWEANVMFLGEAPGKHEEEQDIFFVGEAGRKLDDALTAFGLYPDVDFFWHNVALCRPKTPPGSGKENRTPTKEEVACCRKHLDRVVQAQCPALIVLVGGIAAQAIMKEYPGKVGAIVGKFFGSEEHNLNVDADLYSIWHPAYILRNREQEAGWRMSLVRLRDYMLGCGLRK